MNFSYNSGTANLFNPKVRRQKFGFGGMLFLVLFGVALTAAGVFIYKSQQIDASWQRITGTVTAVNTSNSSSSSTTYSPVVTYKVSGASYQATSSISSSSYPDIGSRREVAYNPNQPGQSKIVGGVGNVLFAAAFTVPGLAMLLLSPYFFIRSRRRTADINQLVSGGIKIQGIISNIITGSSYSGSGVQSNNGGYKIEVSASDSNGNVRTYTSDNLAGIGGLAMADFRSNPIPIDVYLNPTDPNDYYVDISDVPNLTGARIAELIQQTTHRQPTTPQPGQTPGQPTPVAPNPATTPPTQPPLG